MKKKIISMLLVTSMSLGLMACGSSEEAVQTTKNSEAATAKEEVKQKEEPAKQETTEQTAEVQEVRDVKLTRIRKMGNGLLRFVISLMKHIQNGILHMNLVYIQSQRLRKHFHRILKQVRMYLSMVPQGLRISVPQEQLQKLAVLMQK